MNYVWDFGKTLACHVSGQIGWMQWKSWSQWTRADSERSVTWDGHAWKSAETDIKINGPSWHLCDSLPGELGPLPRFTHWPWQEGLPLVHSRSSLARLHVQAHDLTPSTAGSTSRLASVVPYYTWKTFCWTKNTSIYEVVVLVVDFLTLCTAFVCVHVGPANWCVAGQFHSERKPVRHVFNWTAPWARDHLPMGSDQFNVYTGVIKQGRGKWSGQTINKWLAMDAYLAVMNRTRNHSNFPNLYSLFCYVPHSLYDCSSLFHYCSICTVNVRRITSYYCAPCTLSLWALTSLTVKIVCP